MSSRDLSSLVAALRSSLYRLRASRVRIWRPVRSRRRYYYGIQRNPLDYMDSAFGKCILSLILSLPPPPPLVDPRCRSRRRVAARFTSASSWRTRGRWCRRRRWWSHVRPVRFCSPRRWSNRYASACPRMRWSECRRYLRINRRKIAIGLSSLPAVRSYRVRMYSEFFLTADNGIFIKSSIAE